MTGALRISDAANLAIHAVTILAHGKERDRHKLKDLSRTMRASAAHLAKVMHRLAQEGIVESRRGPEGGFSLGRRAGELTLMDLYELFDGHAASSQRCLLGYARCPFGGCVLGKPLARARTLLWRALRQQRISKLGKGRTP